MKEDFYKLEAKNFVRLEGGEMFSCRFKNHGWAILVLDDKTGLFNLQSDYGDWSYIWPPYARSQSLKEFVCDGDYDYLAGKLMGRGDSNEFDFEATVEALKRVVLQDRRSDAMSATTARVLFDHLESLSPTDSANEFYDDLSHDFKDCYTEVWELYEYHPKAEWMWLKEGILPALVAELRKTLPAKEAA